MDVHTFCERSVDVMGEESDHIHAQALTDAVQVSSHKLSTRNVYSLDGLTGNGRAGDGGSTGVCAMHPEAGPCRDEGILPLAAGPCGTPTDLMLATEQAGAV
jgi:hypothetical protein